MKVVRLVGIGAPVPPGDLPAAAAWVVGPAAVGLVAESVRDRRAPRVVIDGAVDGPAWADAARIEGPVTATAIQRALRLGAPIVVAAGPPGAAAVGVAAWYHGWSVDGDRSRFAGALAGAVVAAAARGPTTTWTVDAAGTVVVDGVSRAEALARLLLAPGSGPAAAEAAVSLPSVHVLDAGGAVRITGARSAGSAGGPASAVRWTGRLHPVDPVPPERGSHAPIDLEEPTWAAPSRRGPASARELVRATAVEHRDHAVLAVVLRHADDWQRVADWASADRAARWFGTSGRVVRTPLPNLSALRFVCSAPDRAPAATVGERVLHDAIEADDPLR